jgi:AraC-like DNA-binding protein
MPDSSVLTVTDPYEYQRLLRNADVKLIVTQSGKYQAELTRITLHRLLMQRSHDVLPRLFHTTVTTSRIICFFLTREQQAPFFHSRKELLPSEIMVYAPGTDHYQRSTAASHWGTMSLSADDLAAAGGAITGREVLAPAMTQRIRPSAESVLRLRSLHMAAGDLAVDAPDILTNPAVARAIEQGLIRAMVQCLTEGDALEERAPGHTRLPIMRRFEQAVSENEGKLFYVAELCAAVGVSERTLRLHCLEHLEISPHRYLWLRRMHQVRRALALADPALTTVTSVATEYGFWELGRFSVAYRRLFGESPSLALRRGP